MSRFFPRQGTTTGTGHPSRGVAWPILLLMVVAVAQMVARTSFGLSAWKGGGFGMFSTNDSPAHRKARIWLQDETGAEYPALVPKHLSDDAMKCRTWPRRSCLERLGAQLGALRWVPLTLARAEDEYARLTDSSEDERSAWTDADALHQATGEQSLAVGVLRAQTDDEANVPSSIQATKIKIKIVQTQFLLNPTRLQMHEIMQVMVRP